MGDPQARYYRRLRRLRGSARRWSVFAGILGGATVILVPYSGLGIPDAFWAAGAGGSVVLAAWRWLDLRALASQPAPPPAVRRVDSVLGGLPGGREVLGELRRARDLLRMRGSAVAVGWKRLDRASLAMRALVPRLGGPGESAVLEAAVAERGLRELAERTAGVERGLRVGGSPAALGTAHAALVAQFEEGVTAYEELVGAAAAYVAEDGLGSPSAQPAVSRLTEATDLLRGIVAGFVELRQPSPPAA